MTPQVAKHALHQAAQDIVLAPVVFVESRLADVGGGDQVEQVAPVGLARGDRRVAAVAGLGQCRKRVEPIAALGLVGAVAALAAAEQDELARSARVGLGVLVGLRVDLRVPDEPSSRVFRSNRWPRYS